MLCVPIDDTSTVRGFFKTRPRFWVDPCVEVYTGLRESPVGRDSRRVIGRVLESPATEEELFGQLGTPRYQKTLAEAVDLSQIAELIRRQEHGEGGELLIDGFKNLFPARDVDGGLCIIRCDWSWDYPRRWTIDCYPYNPHALWHEGNKVFMNSSDL